ncbi:DnaJ-domain-containing protein [Lentinus tigrinus ALCF2SS1-6]|uniref:DnaJ-domain-containing protein n=1 Tax=Lentinus tigrinus ALCF2SS1-6 TaxID=1328759 RepID=A0A5C2RRX6_9APHY|nr:DnaJ-domain-containing protein [Lentinus tigrinus ALCF2SS1-6]
MDFFTELHPGEPQYYLTRAMAYVKTLQYTEALQDFDDVSKKDGYEGDVDVFLQVARCRLLLGSPTPALLAVRNALAFDPGDRDALNLRRRILDLIGHIDAYKGAVSRKHWRMARSAYESCLSVYAQEDSDAPTYIRCWGIEMLVVEGCWDEAQKSVDIILREDVDAVEAMILRALVLFLRAELSDAVTQILAVSKVDPDNQQAKDLAIRVQDVARLKNSGNNAFSKGNWPEAKQAWSDALQVVKDKEEEGCGGVIRATLLMNRATVHQKLGSFAEGLKDINESLKLRGTYFKAFLCRARLLVGLELYETAAEDFRAALERGRTVMSEAEVRKVEAELDHAERFAVKERQKEQDHYVVLGLGKFCTAAEIKKAYRTLSLKHHPDKGGVAEKFKMIARAYEVLSDPEQKRAYDAKQQRSAHSTSSRYDDDYDSDGDSGYW